jgi:hypothetical protein
MKCSQRLMGDVDPSLNIESRAERQFGDIILWCRRKVAPSEKTYTLSNMSKRVTSITWGLIKSGTSGKAKNKWCRIAICYPNFRNCYAKPTSDLQFATQNYTQTNKKCEELLDKIIFFDCFVWKSLKIPTHRKKVILSPAEVTGARSFQCAMSINLMAVMPRLSKTHGIVEINCKCCMFTKGPKHFILLWNLSCFSTHATPVRHNNNNNKNSCIARYAHVVGLTALYSKTF